MTLEEPMVRRNVEFGYNLAFVIGATVFSNMRNAVKHEHGRQGQPWVAWAEHAAMCTIQQGIPVKTAVMFH